MSISTVKLGDVAVTSSGGTPQRGVGRYYGGSIPWVKSGELPDGMIHKTEESITEEGLRNSSAKLFSSGTLLIAMYGATVGKLGILGVPAATNQAVCSITPGSNLDRDFLFYYLLKIRSSLVDASFGGAQPNISQSVVREIEVPLLDIVSQRRIAVHLKSQLDAVDEARNSAQAQVKELKILSTRALNALFDNICDKRPIGDAAKVQSGFAFKSQDFHTSGVRLLRNANVSPGRIDWVDVVFLPENKCSKIDGYVMQEGDVIISLDRPIISSGIKVARVIAADLPSLLVQRVGRFLLDKTLLEADYLFAFLQTNHFIDAISGHEQSLGVPHISPGQVEAVEIPMPPIEEQRRISAVAKEILDTTAEAHRAAVAMLSDISVLPSRLLAQAFEKFD